MCQFWGGRFLRWLTPWKVIALCKEKKILLVMEQDFNVFSIVIALFLHKKILLLLTKVKVKIEICKKKF